MARLMLAHGSLEVRHSLRRALAGLEPGAEFAETERADQVVQLDADWGPDIVFIGLILADDESGLPALKELLARKPLRPIVLCTRLASDHPEVVQALSSGVAAHLHTPVTPAALRAALTEVRRMQRSLTALHPPGRPSAGVGREK